MQDIVIREFGYIYEASSNGLTEKEFEPEDIDCRFVSSASWKYLREIALSSEKKDRFLKLTSSNGREALQVKNFVGVLSLPDGMHIEILPKTKNDNQDIRSTRVTLLKLLSAVPDLKFIETKEAILETTDAPLLECLIARFLKILTSVVRSGIRKDYHRIEEEEKFLRGRLLIAKQIRQPIGKQHYFQISYDIFSDNRAENRLIHSALRQVTKWSRDDNNRKLAHELRFAFNDVPFSMDYKSDFALWKTTRDMVKYQPLFPWLKLILFEKNPRAIKGENYGISFLFPMEELFEKYVAQCLKNHLAPIGYDVKTKLSSKYISNKPQAFRLEPDIAIFEKSSNSLLAILDTKWKLIDKNAKYDDGRENKKSDISQSDMYQLFAYGHKYMGGKGKLVLIYPYWENFKEKLEGFKLGNEDDLNLEVFPFNIEAKDEGDKFCYMLQSTNIIKTPPN